MAEKRMFAKQIIDSDVFLDMPLSTQALYFHLSMRADDDGFVDNPNKIQRMIGASPDDLKLLMAKRYILTFESGVIVIKHWRMHNTLRMDRYKPTVYQEEMSTLAIKGNKSYTEANRLAQIEDGKPTGNQLATQIRLDKNSIDKNKDIVVETTAASPYKEIIDYLNEKTNARYRHTTKATQRIINGRISDGFGVEDFKKVIDIKADQWLNDKKMSAYLRPETLFAASHFESYLNEARQTVKESKYPGISEKLNRETEEKIGSIDDVDSGEFE
ncbi:MAG: conserved phage C-terminal domain-containing protein [Lachnospiraceae bacterium]|nr:conserved phage C-terminal domain-containing protein [Lachnospiraceae bacterium]